MKTDNELIAEFMGGVFHKLDDGFGKINERWFFLNNPNPHANASTYKSIDDLDYHKRWDWLMPVVEKIDILDHDKGCQFSVTISPYDCLIKNDNDETPIIYKQWAKEEDTRITFTYAAVVEFIKWYNSQLLTPKQETE